MAVQDRLPSCRYVPPIGKVTVGLWTMGRAQRLGRGGRRGARSGCEGNGGQQSTCVPCSVSRLYASIRAPRHRTPLRRATMQRGASQYMQQYDVLYAYSLMTCAYSSSRSKHRSLSPERLQQLLCRPRSLPAARAGPLLPRCTHAVQVQRRSQRCTALQKVEPATVRRTVRSNRPSRCPT